MAGLPLSVADTELGSMVELAVVCAEVKVATRRTAATEDLTYILTERAACLDEAGGAIDVMGWIRKR